MTQLRQLADILDVSPGYWESGRWQPFTKPELIAAIRDAARQLGNERRAKYERTLTNFQGGNK